MTSLKKTISSIMAVCAICSALTIGASADMISTDAVASTTGTTVSFNFNRTYQPYMAFFTGTTTRYASYPKFKTTITTITGPRYTSKAAVYAPASDAGPYSSYALIRGTGTYSADYIYYSPTSTENRPVVMGIGFDTRETSGTTFKIVGKFYPNAN